MVYFLQKYAGLRNQSRLVSTTRAIIKEDLVASAYQPGVLKNKYDEYEKTGVFRPDTYSHANKFSMVLPPPNVTGKLHLGHALTCTIQDVIARRMRSLDRTVVWVPGTDHAGSATQTVVEKHLLSRWDVPRQSLMREEFVDEVWKWKEKYGGNINEQLRTLGCSLDWSKEVFTMNPAHTRAVNMAFIMLLERGLMHRREALINWCNALRSTVSDIEIDKLELAGPTDVTVPGYSTPVKFGQMYNFAYKVFGTGEDVIVSTTQPETMMGDVAIAVHPDDERYKHLIGKRVFHPFRRDTMPIIFDEFVDPKFGTGAVKITPAHSKVDYEIGKKHNLPVIKVFSENGVVEKIDLSTKEFEKFKRYEARELIVQELNDLGFMRDVVPHKMTLPICSRTGDVIEYLPKEQWFLSCSEMSKRAAEAVESGKLRLFPERFVKTWQDWTNEDRDWCVSRQLWWGHRVPAYQCTCQNESVWTVALDENAARVEAASFLRADPDLIVVERDTDVLDTWFSSAIYPFAALGWPDKSHADYQKFYPLDLMVTGNDILGFWVHRMAMLGMELTGELPFDKVLLHGVICDHKGSKMSKSKGNVIDPLDVIKGISMEDLKKKAENMRFNGVLTKKELEKALAYHKANFSKTRGIPECGLDALRFTLLSQDVRSQFVNFDVSFCHSNKLFCNKIWQSVRYLQLCHKKLQDKKDDVTKDDLQLFDRWILSKLSGTVENVNRYMDNYEFHLATKGLRSFIYNQMCDVYVEATKSGFRENAPAAIGYAHAHTLAAVLSTSLRCLHPFMTELTEELIPKIPDFEKNIIYEFNDEDKSVFDFPKVDQFEVWKDADAECQGDKVLETLGLVRTLKGQFGLTNKCKPSVSIKTSNEALRAAIASNICLFVDMARCSKLDFEDPTSGNFVKGILDKETQVSVEVIGTDTENSIKEARRELQKKIIEIESSLERVKCDSNMSNEQYEKKRQELEQLQKLME